MLLGVLHEYFIACLSVMRCNFHFITFKWGFRAKNAKLDVPREVGTDVVSHGCTGKGKDQVRFELIFFALNPDLNVVAPWREWDITGREDAKKHNIPVITSYIVRIRNCILEYRME
ncbi:hypothetical protein GQ457_07G008920 [Hibiscus cannabinus]